VKITHVKKSLGLKKHSILLAGDSHARGISERLVSYLGSSYHCTGYVKHYADLNIITSTGSLDVKTLDKNYVVISIWRCHGYCQRQYRWWAAVNSTIYSKVWAH
jgi:hypothetical protein